MSTILFEVSITNVAGFIFGIIGIVLSIIFYLKSRRFKKLSYSTRSFSLLSGPLSSLPEFSASYKGESLENLTAIKIILWNSGTELISRADISESDPLRIILPKGHKILDARISESSTTANLPELIYDSGGDNILTINFDYLGVREGTLISILHTGSRDQELKIQGTIKGFGAPTLRSEASSIRYLGPLFAFVAGIAFGYYSTALKWFLLPISILFVAGMIYLQRLMRKRTRGKLDNRFEDGFTPNDFT